MLDSRYSKFATKRQKIHKRIRHGLTQIKTVLFGVGDFCLTGSGVPRLSEFTLSWSKGESCGWGVCFGRLRRQEGEISEVYA
jgi:hypothetical protein